MQLGETIATYDVDLALRGETGKFEVTSPNGDTYFVTCKSNQSSLTSHLTDNRDYPQAFLIRKIAESVSLERSVRDIPMTGAELAASDSNGLFLLENRQDETVAGNERPSMPAGAEHDTQPEAWNMNLSYRESAASQLATAMVVATRDAVEPSSGTRGLPLTVACCNYNELDSQIRRLHAQLEDIRVQAKKKFYKAHAAAASA
jgi:hypothetical protein